MARAVSMQSRTGLQLRKRSLLNCLELEALWTLAYLQMHNQSHEDNTFIEVSHIPCTCIGNVIIYSTFYVCILMMTHYMQSSVNISSSDMLSKWIEFEGVALRNYTYPSGWHYSLHIHAPPNTYIVLFFSKT